MKSSRDGPSSSTLVNTVLETAEVLEDETSRTCLGKRVASAT